MEILKIIDEYRNDYYQFYDDMFLRSKKAQQFRQIFRGTSKKEYDLVPGAMRDSDNRTVEEQIYFEHCELSNFYRCCNNHGLYINAPQGIKNFSTTKNIQIGMLYEYDTSLKSLPWLPHDYYELTGLAQHYGMKTRLLDWSHDSDIATYFAVIGAIKAKIKDQVHDKHNDNYFSIWALNIDFINDFNIFLINLNKTVKEEMRLKERFLDTFPLKIIEPNYFGNPNLNAQKGLFTLWEDNLAKGEFNKLLDMPFICHSLEYNLGDYFDIPEIRALLDVFFTDPRYETYKNTSIITRYNFNDSMCTEVYAFLSRQGVGAASVFPGYNGVVEEIREYQLVEKLNNVNKQND